MVERSVHRSVADVQRHARAAVDRYCIYQLALTILRLRLRDSGATFAWVTEDERKELLETAACALFANDPERHRAALYAGADELRPISTMAPSSRVWFTGEMAKFIREYRRVLAADASERERYAVLALEDMKAVQG